MPPKPKYPCLVCHTNVADKSTDGSIACCVCKRWAHPKCIDLPPEVLNHFRNSVRLHGKHLWGCDGCLKGFHEFSMQVVALDEKVKGINKQVDINTESINKVTDRVSNLEKQVEKQKVDAKQDKAEIVKEANKAWSQELRDRENRKANLVIYALPEPPAFLTNKHERKGKDNEALITLLKELGVQANVDMIKFSVRTGEYRDNVHTKPRPFLVGFKCQQTREDILNKAKNLKDSATFSRTSIVPDLTRQQRDEDNELMKEMEQKNEEMSEEEASNWEWRCLGRRGGRNLVKCKVNKPKPRSQTSRRSPSTLSGANMEPMGNRKRASAARLEPEEESAEESDTTVTEEEQQLPEPEPEEGGSGNRQGTKRNLSDNSPEKTSTKKQSR